MSPRPTARVLVLDDSPPAAKALEQLVRRVSSHQVEVVVDLSAARAKERLEREAFDLVLADWVLKDGDGLDVLASARIRQPKARRALVTAYVDRKLPQLEVKAAGLDAFLEKPLHPEHVTAVVEALLRAREASPSRR